MSIYKYSPIAIAIVMASFSSTAGAAGFQRIDSQTSFMSTAGAGQATDVNASAAFNNPAGLVYLEQAEFDGRLLLVQDSFNYQDQGSTGITPGFDTLKKDVDYGSGFGGGGSFFYGQPLNDSWSLGMSLTSPFGGSADFGDNWVGANFVKSSDVMVAELSMALGYKIDSQWSVGIVYGIGYMSWEVDLDVPPIMGIPPGSEEAFELDDTAPVFSLGVMYQPNEATRLGLRYVSSVTFNLQGDATLGTPMGNIDDQATLAYELPDVVTLSVEHDLRSDLRVLADLEWASWSVNKENRIIHDSGMEIKVNRNWRDVLSGAVGLSYDVNSTLTLSGGISYDESPVSKVDHKLDPPVDRQVSYAIGGEMRLNQESDLTFSYRYLDLGDIEVSQVIPDPAMPMQTIRGESEAHVHMVSLGYRYRF